MEHFVVIIPITLCCIAGILENERYVEASARISSANENYQKNSNYLNKSVVQKDQKNASRILSFQNTVVQNLTSKQMGFNISSPAITTALSTTEATKNYSNVNIFLYHKFQSAITKSKDAVWASIALTFVCVVLLLAVAHSKMWRDYNGSEAQGIPLPNFNERVLFKDVMERKLAIVKELLSKGKKKKSKAMPLETELESLLQDTESE